MSPEQLEAALCRAREYVTEVENGVTQPLPPDEAIMVAKALLRLDMDRRPSLVPSQTNVWHSGMRGRSRRR